MPNLLSIVNILATDFCNHSCNFCFASKEMKSSSKKEFDLREYAMVVNKCKEAGFSPALSGGEPTLHSKFPELLKMTLQNFFHVPINTGGLFTDETEKYMFRYRHRIALYFNISTPGFVFNKVTRAKVIKRIRKFAGAASKVSLIVTSKFLSSEDAKIIINLIDDETIKKCTVRLGVEGVVAGEKAYAGIDQFPTMGNNFFTVFKYVEAKKPKAIIFAKSLTPCMFTEEQRKYLKSKGYLKSYHCHPKEERFHFSITPQLETFVCYPLSSRNRSIIKADSSFEKINKEYESLHKKQHKEYVLSKCKKCPFFGLREGQCPGPCLGFKISLFEKEKGIDSSKLSSYNYIREMI